MGFVSRCTAAAGLFVIALPATAEPEPGWTLQARMGTAQTFLTDLDGNVVHTWNSSFAPGLMPYLLEDGDIVRPAVDGSIPGPAGAGIGGRVERIAWDGTVEWSYAEDNPATRQHHDIEVLPNGNVLILQWEAIPAADALAAGRNPTLLPSEVWSERIIEVRPTGPTSGEIVWEWRAWDHLIQDLNPALPNFGVVADYPERIDINYVPRGGGDPDWLHINGMDYNADLDQIVLSINAFDEFWIISHAPGASGEILYRWGNPQAYQMGTASDQTLFNQHDARWIEDGLRGAGNILVYNNGVARPEGQFSSVDEIVTPVNPDGTYARNAGEAFGPPSAVWSCENAGGSSFYSPIISGAQRLPNGNTLICVGQPGIFYEVDESCQLQWTQTPGGLHFRATRIGIRDPRLRDLLWCGADVAEPYGVLNFFDVAEYIAQFAASDPAADLDGNGSLNFFDVSNYIARYNAGCP
ncbi:MAG: aryl-sulfate sulfotransferase [Planctomycetota bacterium]